MVAEQDGRAHPSPQLQRHASGFLLGESVESSHGSINYQLWGDSCRERPLVVTIHGLLGAMHAYAGVAAKMASHGFNVLTFDLYGFGLSKSPRKRFDAELYVQQTLELLSLLGYGEKKFYLIGFSMGGVIAMELARQFPERVVRSLLVAPAGLLSLSRSERCGIMGLRAARTLHIPAASALAKLSRYAGRMSVDFEPDGTDAEKCRQAAADNARMFWSDPEKYTKAWIKSVRDMRLSGGQKLYERLAQSGAEVMFLWGDSDGTVPLQEVQDDLRTFFPTAPVLVVKNAGHSLLLEHSEAVAYNALYWFNGAASPVAAPAPLAEPAMPRARPVSAREDRRAASGMPAPVAWPVQTVTV